MTATTPGSMSHTLGYRDGYDGKTSCQLNSEYETGYEEGAEKRRAEMLAMVSHGDTGAPPSDCDWMTPEIRYQITRHQLEPAQANDPSFKEMMLRLQVVQAEMDRMPFELFGTERNALVQEKLHLKQQLRELAWQLRKSK